MYTERYMGFPTASDNLAGYNRSDLTRHVEGIRGKKYMLIHGSKDHNVHYQHTMMLAKSLEQKNIPFEQVTYTDEVHSLWHVQPHLYHTMDNFWSDCFNLGSTSSSSSILARLSACSFYYRLILFVATSLCLL